MSLNEKKKKRDPVSLLKDITLTDKERLKILVVDITSKGEIDLDIEYLKAIKYLCKKSDENVMLTYDYIWNQLKKKHSQIRYSCVQLIDYLFQRAVIFRKKIVENLPEMLDLTICCDKLPLPKNWASKLKILTFKTMTEWDKNYGNKNKQIKIGFDYMKNNQKATIEREIEIQRQNEEKFQKLLDIIEEKREIINDTINVMDSCFHILIPDIPINIPLNQKDLSEKLKSNNEKVVYPIVITPDQDDLLRKLNIKETSENTIIFQKLREYYNQIKTERLKEIGNWILKLNNIETNDINKKNETLSNLNIWKKTLSDIKDKCEKLNIMELRTILNDEKNKKAKGKEKIDDDELNERLFGSETEIDDDSESDEIFEEVPLDIEIKKTEKTPNKSNANVVTTNSTYNKIFNIDYSDYKDLEKDPTVMNPKQLNIENNLKNEEKQTDGLHIPDNTPDDLKELYKTAPVVEFNDDLLYWGRTKIQFNEFSGMERSHRFFGVSEGNNYISDETLERLQKRAIYFPKKERVIYPECRARMPNGSLCKRRDIYNCPYHGKIIPRDDQGNPIINEKEVTNDSINNKEHNTNRETFYTKRRKLNKDNNQTKAKAPHLIDIKKINNTPKNRIMNALRKKEKSSNVDAMLKYDAQMKYRNKKAFLWE
ncbi:hypothetical protein BCR32DRAFT_98776 [Anaeromyces robustus]|uniref:UV-stimulated scaffold protein A C-terminal domain-containing protein n=1 Tax=Anaeromyces robustus TaxID=1754192 RepID=A0A1Y1WND0_9FUNG|nr:hypothetical protein BCR32DRAFT_98776 [Anaeromyces robustus]|eukprot:ORX75069.1 hypothetical protein BCR32DRAFT_98776 [Anaeromyces robustus]